MTLHDLGGVAGHQGAGKGRVQVTTGPGLSLGPRHRPRSAREVPQARMELALDTVALAPALASMPWVQGDMKGRAVSHEDIGRVKYLIDNVMDSALWFVEPNMCELLRHAWPTVPATTLDETLPPARSGVVFFATPMVGLDADSPGGTVIVNAMSWQWVGLEQLGCDALGIVPWQCWGPSWSPMGRTDWPLGEDTDTEMTVLDVDGEAATVRHASQTEDRRMLAALWLLASQERVAETSRVGITNQSARRRYEKEHRARPPLVNVIDVRRPAGEGVGPAGPRSVEWTRRWMVDGHWRQQAHGPGRTLRRPTYIAPFMKGPADKPLVLTDKVRTVR